MDQPVCLPSLFVLLLGRGQERPDSLDTVRYPDSQSLPLTLGFYPWGSHPFQLNVSQAFFCSPGGKTRPVDPAYHIMTYGAAPRGRRSMNGKMVSRTSDSNGSSFTLQQENKGTFQLIHLGPYLFGKQ